jgi:hypothetical protein
MGKRAATTQSRYELEWRARLTRYSTSGQTAEAFCQSESVSTGSLYHWQARLRKRGFVISKPRVRRQTAAAFIDVGTIPKTNLVAHPITPVIDIEKEGGFDIKLELGGGVVLHLVRR